MRENRANPSAGMAGMRNYKDTVFRRLFQDRERLLELYNAMNGTNYENPEVLEIVTLENAVYMNVKNDLAFLVGMQIHLYEQQSTVSPNMPYRFLQYVVREFEKLVDSTRIYGSRLLELPAPRFVVFYNGMREQPEKTVLRLSDAYRDESGEPQLELVVQVLNINSGQNRSLLEDCRTLREYMQYVETVRNYSMTMDIHEAVNQAVEDCIRKGILEQFLRQNKAEVVAMSIFEYDEEAVMKVIREEERELGREEGQRKLMEQLVTEGVLSLEQAAEKLGIAPEEFVECVK